MAKSKFAIGSSVQWNWLGRKIHGQVEQIFTESTLIEIKGKKIKRNGTPEKPAYLVKSEAGNLALKLQSELESELESKIESNLKSNSSDSRSSSNSLSKSKPKIFSEPVRPRLKK